MRARRQGAGFSLLELLIVLAIVVILAALLFPVFSLARAKARSLACQSNLRQLGQAMAMYAQDWDDYLPAYDWWQERLLCYARSHRLFECPSEKERPFVPDVPWPGGRRTPGGAYNMNLPVLPLVNIGAAHESQIEDAAGTVLAHDGPGGITTFHDAPTSLSDLRQHGVVARHESGTNVLWADGHVRWSSMEGLLNLNFWRTGLDH